MKVTIVGSGGWDGIPSPFCTCHLCNIAKKNPTIKDTRTRPEILVEGEKGNFLIEISPDIRLQSTRFNLPLIKDFLDSHWHFDHLYGIMELHAWSEFIMNKDITIYCSRKTKEWMDNMFAHIPKQIKVLKPYEPFNLYGIAITPLPVCHMRVQDEETQDNVLENTFGYMLEHNSKKVVYLADYYKLPQKTIELVKGSDIIIADGTYLLEELFPDKTMQNELKSDPDHLHGQEIIDLMIALQTKEVIFHSITHLTEKTHDELQALLPATMKLSFDGMLLENS